MSNGVREYMNIVEAARAGKSLVSKPQMTTATFSVDINEAVFLTFLHYEDHMSQTLSVHLEEAVPEIKNIEYDGHFGSGVSYDLDAEDIKPATHVRIVQAINEYMMQFVNTRFPRIGEMVSTDEGPQKISFIENSQDYLDINVFYVVCNRADRLYIHFDGKQWVAVDDPDEEL